MATALPTGVTGARCALISDAAYLPTLQRLIHDAVGRIDASLFLVDLTPGADGSTAVDDVLRALQSAQWRGVRVRLLLGGSRDNLSILHATHAALLRARQLGLPARLLAAHMVRGSHAKFVIVDQRVLLGSQNWSHGAFFTQTQDALLIDSRDLAAQLGTLYAAQWQRRRAQRAGANTSGPGENA